MLVKTRFSHNNSQNRYCRNTKTVGTTGITAKEPDILKHCAEKCTKSADKLFYQTANILPRVTSSILRYNSVSGYLRTSGQPSLTCMSRFVYIPALNGGLIIQIHAHDMTIKTANWDLRPILEPTRTSTPFMVMTSCPILASPDSNISVDFIL